MAAAVLPPPSKRQRLQYSTEATVPQTNLKLVGKDVLRVFSLWKRVHCDALEPITTAGLSASLKDLAHAHVAAQCALAPILPRLLKKVSVSHEVQLETVSAILGAIHVAPRGVQDAAAEAVLPLLPGLLSQDALDSTAADSIKDTFKALALSVLVLYSRCRKHHATLMSVASLAFERRPYWFIIALTDALEDGDHPALRGAVAFGKEKLLSGGLGSTFFQEVMATDSTASSQAAMLLRSCINEVRGKPQLADSLQIMLQLDQLLDTTGSSPTTHMVKPTAALPTVGSQWPSSRERPSRFSAPGKPFESAELPLPGPPPRQPSTHERERAATPAAPSYAVTPPHEPVALPPPPKRRSTPPASRSPSPVRPSPVRSEGYNASPTPGAAAVWRPQASLAKVTAQQMIGDASQLDCRVARVAPTLCVTGLPHRVSSRDLCRALPSQRKLAHIEVLPDKCAIIQFAGMQAALGCMLGLSNSLNRLGWRFNATAFASHSFAASSAPREHWVWLATYGRQDCFEGILHICRHAGVPSPTKHYLVNYPTPAAQQGCLLQFESSQQADAGVACIQQWLLDQLNSDQPDEEGHPEDAVEDSRQSKDSAAMSPDAAEQSAPDPEPVWRGSVAKSAVRQCAVCIMSATDVMARECRIWQDSLDVQHRTTIPQAVQAWQEHAEEHRGSAWLHPDGDEAPRFATFVQYLTDRNRAGIARPAPPGTIVHTVYLIPASQEICDSLKITADESSGLLLLLIVNQAPMQ